ncbi:class I SAM-dependent methyltransferase [Haloarcula salinisoli]|uniref:Class I SAM-dependent methyltransferase n=1 Tax=Haloarcula salinisoli TaxID=2487746 RepID=A0A8J7Y9W6_9EURY|nr:class I SAM-dependent methyltransferase [Halomicroarcula salinisoli]MBX0302060.1 class I SAM-dependent methyltransferase [Halomicroarcula salinisoli]
MGNSARFHPWIARLYDYINVYFEHRQAPAHREYLAREVSGTVVEIGAGTGTMLPYLERESAGVAEYCAVEPDPGMREQLARRLRDVAFDGDVVAARAEQLPFADDSADAVLASCVFCSIHDIDGALAEIARVLAPDGEFRFFEHVRSPGLVGRSQDLLTPLWRRAGGNCHLNREFLPRVSDHPALALTEAETHTAGHYPIREFARGRASPEPVAGRTAPSTTAAVSDR